LLIINSILIKQMKIKIILLLICSTLVAQQNKSVVKIEYSETIKYIPTIVNHHSATLYIQNEYSHYESVYLNTEKISENEEEDMIMVNSPMNKLNKEVYINNKTKQLTENLFEDIFLKKSFSITDDLPKMKWIFLKGEKKFNNFICKKAKTTFRGRTYNVWYTEKIPVTAGPWKLNGLPGLILFAEDEIGIYKWDVKNIKYPYVEKTINLKDAYAKRNKYKKTTFKAFDSIYIAAINNKIQIIRARSSNRVGSVVGFRYNTFLNRELINEWRTQMEFK
jgi:GLPGLI family protein